MSELRGTLRFGTRALAVTFGQPRYRRALDTHLRSILDPPVATDQTDLSLHVDERPRRDDDDDRDTLCVDRSGATVRWTTAAGHLEVAGREAEIVMHPGALGEAQALFWFSILVQKLLQAHGLVRLHAAGLAIGGRTSVFVGDKGAGKSTLSLAMGRRGAVVLGDDQLALEVDGPDVAVAGSYPGIRLTAETEAHFLAEPLAVEPVVLAGVAKKEVPLGAVVPAAPYVAHRPHDLWFPAVGAGFAVVPMSRQTALTRLLRSLAPLHRFADGADRVHFVDLLTALVDVTIPRGLVLSPDLGDLDRLWDELASA